MNAIATTTIAGTRQMPGLLSLVATRMALASNKPNMALTKQNEKRTPNGNQSNSVLLANAECPMSYIAIQGYAFAQQQRSFERSDSSNAKVIRGGSP